VDLSITFWRTEQSQGLEVVSKKKKKKKPRKQTCRLRLQSFEQNAAKAMLGIVRLFFNPQQAIVVGD